MSRMSRRWGLLRGWCGRKMAQPLRKTIWHLLKSLNMELSCVLEIPLVGIDPRESKTHVYTKTYTHVYSSIIHDSQQVEITQMSIIN